MLFGVYMATFWTLRTKASKIIHTHNAFGMFMSAIGTMATESSIIPGAVFLLGSWINVEKCTLFVGAGIKFRVKEAFRHFRHIIDV